MRFRKRIVIVNLVIIIFSLYGEENPSRLIISPLASLNIENLMFYDYYRIQLDYSTTNFLLHADMSLINDGKYSPSEAYLLGRYFYLNDNSLTFFTDTLKVSAGYLIAESNLNSPYSLYISSSKIPTVGINFTYDGENFFYNNRWIRLNEHSQYKYINKNEYWRDRGANHKTFGLLTGNWRYGFQDTVVYLDRSFDAKYFFAPMPQYFVQLATTTNGKPWTEQNNDNSLMGFFCEYEDNTFYANGQILIDDINASALPGINASNLTKIAWSLGSYYQSPVGKFGFFHGGATKYTFAATYTTNSYSDLPYEYSYYPATEYLLNSGEIASLFPEENAIGYLHGENNIAFLLSYEHNFFTDKLFNFHLKTKLEWILNGSKSPSNPWHQYTWIDEIEPHYELLTDSIIEHILRLETNLINTIGPFQIDLFIAFSGVFNGLKLQEIVKDEPKIFIPVSGNDSFQFKFNLSLTYHWKIF